MNLKYATLGLISGYLAGYVLEYLNENKKTANATAYTNDLEEDSATE